MDSSRTGSAKRICDACHNKDEGLADDSNLPSVNIDQQLDSATAVLARLGKGGTSDKAASGVTPAEELTEDATPALPKVPTKLPPRASTRDLPTAANTVNVSEAVQALKDYPFEGRWKIAFHFASVEMVNEPDKLKGALEGFRASTASVRGRLGKDGYVRAGSRVTINCNLKPKGGSYFQGDCPSFGQFGQDGKITGSTQRTTGRVTITLQMINRARDKSTATVTTSFNLTGTMNKDGVLSGSFTACEISKTANSFAGTFKAYRSDDDDDDDSDSETESSKPTSSRMLTQASTDSDSTDTDSDSDTE